MGLSGCCLHWAAIRPFPPACANRQTGHKKKLNTYIEFSELLDMGPFMEGTGKLGAMWPFSVPGASSSGSKWCSCVIGVCVCARTGLICSFLLFWD